MLKRPSVINVPPAFAFPRTRAAATALSKRQGVRTGFWYVLSFLMIGPYALLRGQADDVGLPVYGSEIEESIFGGLPTIWLQQHVYELAPTVLEAAAVLVHASWFFIPVFAAFLVTWKRPARIGSFFRWWLLLQAFALVLFALFPMEPPWMANSEVTRIIALRHGGEIYDPNQLAAMPSLHVAFPLLIGLWFTRERWTRPAQAMFAYSALIAVGVVFSGEHYVVDVLGAIALAFLVAMLASLDYVAAFRRLATWLRRTGGPVGKPVPIAHPSPFGSQRAQTLIEFAFVLPLILVFFFSIVDFGIAIDKRIALQHGVREGARFAAVHSVENDIKQRTVDQSQGIVDLADVDVCYEDGADANTTVGDAGDSVRVQSSFTWTFPIMTEMLGAFGVPALSIDLTPHGSARLERSVAGAMACPP